jgi:hypothetical protein
MTETEHARRLVIAYAILPHALERSYPELKPEYSFAPKWWRVTAYVIRRMHGGPSSLLACSECSLCCSVIDRPRYE